MVKKVQFSLQKSYLLCLTLGIINTTYNQRGISFINDTKCLLRYLLCRVFVLNFCGHLNFNLIDNTTKCKYFNLVKWSTWSQGMTVDTFHF